MIISGGVNIYPQEAENVLIGHPKVVDVAVIGVPNEDFGEEVKAVVQLLDASEAGPALEAELLAYCRQHLASYKCPRSVDFDAALPRHADRQALQAAGAGALLANLALDSQRGTFFRRLTANSSDRMAGRSWPSTHGPSSPSATVISRLAA